ncbi:hypothetical protein EC843_106148 [Buttiauxella sp. JUb87]|nr:hypothetical protein [Buttiauxella sp. JUb87]TDN50228.1 hypothetical protein EC843_106148 [Buttiauxella sp. JUb87]
MAYGREPNVCCSLKADLTTLNLARFVLEAEVGIFANLKDGY